MGIIRSIRKGFGHVFDLRVDKWMGVQNLKETAGYFSDQAKLLFSPSKMNSINRGNDKTAFILSPEELQEQSQRYKALVAFFLFMAGLLALYTAFILFQGNWMGATMTVALTIYALTCAFRYHFWNFQMQHQRAVTITEWLKSSIKGTL